ncbi:MAG: M3 family oligoendopeptidase [Nitrospirae bacterium]|nr:M3 family oligoendopeptidase [Nitrospirota bacterium]
MTKKTDKPSGAVHATWDLRPLFAGDDDPRIEKQKMEIRKRSYAFINTWKGRGDYLKDPALLARALDGYERWMRDCGTDGNPGYYFWLRSQIDRNNTDLKAKYNKIEEFSKKIGNDIQFFHLRIAKIPPSLQKKFLAYGGLRKYRHFLERIFAESRYLLSEPEEKIMNLKSTTSYGNWVRMTSDFLSREERRVLLEDGSAAMKPLPEILSLMNSQRRNVRDRANRAFNDILVNNVDIAEIEINSVLANKKVDDEIRSVPRPDLPRHISDDVESSTVDALVSAVSGRFSISRAFYKLKAELMGVKRLRYHERNVEYGKIDRRYPYHETVRLVRAVFAGLDPQFADIYDKFISNGQFDVYPRKGKSSGAFCVHHLISQPTYILLNHTNKLADVLTLAHELGHGINNELIREKQHSLDFGTPTSTAEVASTFMEDFVLREILRRADDELRLSIMMMKLKDDVSTIFRQIACYRFEQELHRAFRDKGYLSKEEIGRLFREHMADYMGPSVEQSAGSQNWWVYWSHIRQFFYVYSYASGLLISKSLQNSVHRQPAFISKVKGFLSAGLSDSPKNIFSALGIDISDPGFWNKGLDEVEVLLQETRALAQKMKKITGRRA